MQVQGLQICCHGNSGPNRGIFGGALTEDRAPHDKTVSARSVSSTAVRRAATANESLCL